MTVLGPLPCTACRKLVVVTRIGASFRVMSAANRLAPHACAARKAA